MQMLRKLLTGIVGFPLLVLGLILIPIPGPCVLICFIALFILSFGFDWANKYLEKCKQVFRKIYTTAKSQADKIQKRNNK